MNVKSNDCDFTRPGRDRRSRGLPRRGSQPGRSRRCFERARTEGTSWIFFAFKRSFVGGYLGCILKTQDISFLEQFPADLAIINILCDMYFIKFLGLLGFLRFEDAYGGFGWVSPPEDMDQEP